MQSNRRWLVSVAALLMLTLSTGCQTWFGGMTLPSPRYLEHYPQYFAPDPAFPLPRELASQEDPEGRARGVGAGPFGVAPAAPGVPVPVGPAPGPGGVPLGGGARP